MLLSMNNVVRDGGTEDRNGFHSRKVSLWWLEASVVVSLTRIDDLTRLFSSL